jgi:hypothetical protein
MEVSGQLHAPAALFMVKDTTVPIGWDAGLTPQPVWTPYKGDKYLALYYVTF